MEQALGQELYRMIMARHYLKSAVKLGSYLLSHERELTKGLKKKFERALIMYYSIPFRHSCSWGALMGEFVPDATMHQELLDAADQIMGAKDAEISFFREKDQHEVYRYDLKQPDYCQGKVAAAVLLLAKELQEKIEGRINVLGDKVEFNRARDEVKIAIDGTITK